MEQKAEYRTTEHAEQAAVFEWALWMQERYPALGLLYAIPNGAYKSKAAAKKFKAEGLKSGVPDFCLPVSSTIHYTGEFYHALYIEQKKHGGRVEPNQKVWHEHLRKYGNCVRVSYSADESIDILCWYLNIQKESER